VVALAGVLRGRLVERRRAEAAGGGAPRVELEDVVRDLVAEEAVLLDAEDRAALAARIVRDSVGLGPLEPLLADPEVEEVMVNGPDRVYVERAGRIEPTAVAFADEEELRNAIERILAPLGRRVDELSPMVDARLGDGSRVNVVIPPLALDGPTVSIRRFGAHRPGPRELVALGTLTQAQHDELAAAVAARRSVLVSGGTGAGKTTLLNALSGFVDPAERVVTIEDAAELRLQQPHVVRLESRPAGVEGRGEVTVRDLLRNALRMRPDRIVIGEVRGPEALDAPLRPSRVSGGTLLRSVESGQMATGDKRSNVPFSDAWSELFKEQGWTQRKVAEDLELDRSFLSKALRGANYKRLSADVIARLSELAGLPADYFPEVREHSVIEAVRSDPSLRDRLYDDLGLG
jgi:pilus assembly protein CpaF